MPDMKEVYEMVTQQTPPKPDALDRQRKRQTRTARNRKVGAFAVAATIALTTVVIAVRAANDEPTQKSRTTTPASRTTTPAVDTGSGLFVVDPVTGETTLLLAARGEQTNPERSPDGTRVVYQSKLAGSPPQIFVLEADGTERQLTTLEQGAQDPTWSPDGRQIAFAGRGSDADIFVMNAEGRRIRRLTGTAERDSHPDWSPDGTRIAFQSGSNLGCSNYDECGLGERSDIWVASVPDGTLTSLTTCADPAWSPDGGWIACTVFAVTLLNGQIPEGNLWLVPSDGIGPQERLGEGQFGHWRQNPSWSPDGRSIVFEESTVRFQGGGAGVGGSIQIIDVETGESSVRFVPTEGGESSPSWDTEGILFSRNGSD